MASTGRLPSPHSENWEWQRYAACRGMSSTLFFDSFGERPPARARRVGQAKEICTDCPVIADCRRHAVEAREPYGIWGGLAEEERSALLRSGDPGDQKSALSLRRIALTPFEFYRRA